MQPPNGHKLEQEIGLLSKELCGWLRDAAYLVWSEAGFNSDTGAFYESIDLATGSADREPVRTRVPARQIYCFTLAGDFGWKGDARAIVELGLDWYLKHCWKDGRVATSAVELDGTHLDNTFDLYNQAFAFLGLAYAGEALPERRTEFRERAENLLTILKNTYAHPLAGFRESGADQLPLRSNPHMHLFEAALALEAFGAGENWTALADEIANLALDKFIDPVSGGLREFFDIDWSPIPTDQGRIMEPGHQFEWCWLLLRWSKLRGHADGERKARHLYEIGMTHGIDPDRDAAIMALNDDFTPRDRLVRLWSQTEWLKAAVALARISVGAERDTYLEHVLRSGQRLKTFFQEVPPGLWRDKLDETKTFKIEPAPASSFYHIVCAISELSYLAKDFPK